MDSHNKLLNETSIVNQNKSQSNIFSIKSKFILKRIIDFLQKKQLLKVIKVNKKIQDILNISLNDYKELSEVVEIEIIPAENKYGQFISILNKEEKDNYHIFFNDSKEETKRTYFNKTDNIKKI